MSNFRGRSSPMSSTRDSKVSPGSKLFPLKKMFAFPTKDKHTNAALTKRETYKIITSDGVNRTPKLLYNKYIPFEEWQQNALDFITGTPVGTLDTGLGLQTSSVFASKETTIVSPITGTIASTAQSFIGVQLDTTDFMDMTRLTATEELEADISSMATTRFYFPIIPRMKRKLLSQVTIIIKETPTFFLFDRSSHTVEQSSEESVQVEEDNKYYEYITAGRGRFRKVISTESQTMDLIRKTRTTMLSTTNKKNKGNLASEWDMYDTYEDKIGRATGITFKSGDFAINKSGDKEINLMKSAVALTTARTIDLTPEKQFEVIAQSDAFLDACAKMERLLASNVYRGQQKTFRGLTQPDPFRLDVQFRYHLELLWSFTSDYVVGRNVTGMCWNSLNTDLLAVGYGKYFYQDQKNGLVCCWTIKNPTQPERKYEFDSPVTSVNFSKESPNLLGCGFYDGSVIILDTSSRSKKIIAFSNRETSPSYEPVWQIFWFHGEDYHKNEEQLVTCCQDGRISRHRREKVLNCFPLMRVSRMEGNVKGIDQSRKCRAHDMSVSRHPAALVLAWHPIDTLTYFVGTDEGCIHKCSTNYLHQHMDIFLAHNGPVYSMQFSPFCSKIFLTCGADWCIRIWAEDIGQPLLTINTSIEPVQGATWSPINSTIIASISNNNINLWDIRRKIFVPASTSTSKPDSRNMIVQFTSSGLNLVVGDSDGAVHVYGLEDMPFAPYYQEIALVQAIKKALVTRPELLKELKKIGKPFY